MTKGKPFLLVCLNIWSIDLTRGELEEDWSDIPMGGRAWYSIIAPSVRKLEAGPACRIFQWPHQTASRRSLTPLFSSPASSSRHRQLINNTKHKRKEQKRKKEKNLARAIRLRLEVLRFASCLCSHTPHPRRPYPAAAVVHPRLLLLLLHQGSLLSYKQAR